MGLERPVFGPTFSIKLANDAFTLEVENFLESPPWEVPCLQKLKEELNLVKAETEKADPLSWSRHTRMNNLFSDVMAYVGSDFNSELTTNAWGKSYEMFYRYSLIPEDTMLAWRKGQPVELITMHLCEMPGGFISSLSHYIQTKLPMLKWLWFATSLNPFYEGNHSNQIPWNNQLVLQVKSSWLFFSDGTGDIKNPVNIFEIQRKFQKVGSGVCLVTADGSIDCSDDFRKQEATVSSLQLYETLAAMLVLREGGSFLLKIFTFFESSTICLLYLICCAFSKVDFIKPSLSKPGSSEVYVVGLGFKKKFTSVAEKILTKLGAEGNEILEQKVLFDSSVIDAIFKSRLVRAAKFFCEKQIEAIKYNLKTYNSPEYAGRQKRQELNERKRSCSLDWAKTFGLKRLEHNMMLMRKSSKPTPVKRKVGRSDALTFLVQQSAPDEDKLRKVNEICLKFIASQSDLDFIVEIGYLVETLVRGARYDMIRNSAFCSNNFMTLRYQTRNLIMKMYKNNQLLMKLKPAELDLHDMSHELVYKFFRHLQGGKKECHVNRSNTDLICCHENLQCFLLGDDQSRSLHITLKLCDTMLSLERRKNVFLCKFNLMTRLNVGLVFYLKNFFERVRVIVDRSHEVFGVLLEDFHGASGPMFETIDDIKTTFLNSSQNESKIVLEIIAMENLMESSCYENIVDYNDFMVADSLVRYINRVIVHF